MSNAQILNYLGYVVTLRDGSPNPTALECLRLLNKQYPDGVSNSGVMAGPFVAACWNEARQNIEFAAK